MNRIKLWIVIAGVFLLVNPAAKLLGQQHGSRSVFDSIYTKGMAEVNTNPDISLKCLNKLEGHSDSLTPIQHAKASYLRLKLFYADPDKVKEQETRMFTAPDSLGQKEALVWTAARYLEKSMPDKAIPLLMDAISADTTPDWTILCTIYLCEAYREKQEYLKGAEMLNEVLYKKGSISDLNRAFACNRLAAIYNEWGKPAVSYTDSVMKYSNVCLNLSTKINSISNLAFSQNELSFQYYLKKQFAKALELSEQAVRNFIEAGLKFSAMNALINQGNIYIGMGKFESAIRPVVEASNLCPIEENRNLYMRIYLEFSTIYELMGNYRDALDFQSIGRLLQLDFFRDRIDIQINEQSARFNLIIKEQKIKEEEQKNEFHKKQILFLAITLIVLSISFVISIFYLRLRRKEFIKQKLIEAVVETEASERKRIARDLHDGLGPVLSAINLYFQGYVDAKESEKESIQKKIQQVISDAIDEVSRISHNISPHVLEIHGLNIALKNFISPIVSKGSIKVEFLSEFTERFERNKELTIYRCITELLNNTLKHAQATRITINISIRDKILHIHYTDDGKGFNAGLEKSVGMGLYNIKNRVETFGGQLIIENSPQNGIKVHIEIPL
jgi:signal transduction histidine kinase